MLIKAEAQTTLHQSTVTLSANKNAYIKEMKISQELTSTLLQANIVYNEN